MLDYHIVLDLEMNPVGDADAATGLKTETIEIGAVKISAATNQIIDEFTCLVRPEYNHRIEPNITRLTGITTGEVRSAGSFASALTGFSDWVGRERVRIYSWSPSDHLQLRSECKAKHIAFPDNLRNWIDFQAEYPKYWGRSNSRALSLKDAARLIGTDVAPDCAHRALYDAQITAKLVLFALSGACKRDIGTTYHGTGPMTYTIGDACGNKLAALLARFMNTEEREADRDETESIGTAGAFVR